MILKYKLTHNIQCVKYKRHVCRTDGEKGHYLHTKIYFIYVHLHDKKPWKCQPNNLMWPKKKKKQVVIPMGVVRNKPENAISMWLLSAAYSFFDTMGISDLFTPRRTGKEQDKECHREWKQHQQNGLKYTEKLKRNPYFGGKCPEKIKEKHKISVEWSFFFYLRKLL